MTNISSQESNPFIALPYEMVESIFDFLPVEDQGRLSCVDRYFNQAVKAQGRFIHAERANDAAIDAFKKERISFPALLTEFKKGQESTICLFPVGENPPVDDSLEKAHTYATLPEHLASVEQYDPRLKNSQYHDQLFHKAMAIASEELGYESLDTEEKRLNAARLGIFLLFKQAYVDLGGCNPRLCFNPHIQAYLAKPQLIHVPVFIEGKQILMSVHVCQNNMFNNNLIGKHDLLSAYMQIHELDSPMCDNFKSYLAGGSALDDRTVPVLNLIDELAGFALKQYGIGEQANASELPDLATSDFNAYVKPSRTFQEFFSRGVIWEAQKFANLGLLTEQFFDLESEYGCVKSLIARGFCLEMLKNATPINDFQIRLGNNLEVMSGEIKVSNLEGRIKNCSFVPVHAINFSHEQDFITDSSVDLSLAKRLIDTLEPYELQILEDKLSYSSLEELYRLRGMYEAAAELKGNMEARMGTIASDRQEIIKTIQKVISRFCCYNPIDPIVPQIEENVIV